MLNDKRTIGIQALTPQAVSMQNLIIGVAKGCDNTMPKLDDCDSYIRSSIAHMYVGTVPIGITIRKIERQQSSRVAGEQYGCGRASIPSNTKVNFFSIFVN